MKDSRSVTSATLRNSHEPTFEESAKRATPNAKCEQEAVTIKIACRQRFSVNTQDSIIFNTKHAVYPVSPLVVFPAIFLTTTTMGGPSTAPKCVIDNAVLNPKTLEDMEDIALSFFATACGRNRGAFVLDPPDGQTYSW